MRTRWIVEVEARTAESSGVRSEGAEVESDIVEQGTLREAVRSDSARVRRQREEPRR